MPIVQAELKFFESTNNLGGAITATEIVDGALHNLFDKVNADESLNGDTEYRCFYVANTNASITLNNAYVFLTANTINDDYLGSIGLGTSIVGGTEQSIPDESSAPAGVNFTAEVGENGMLAIGDIPPGSHKAIWVKRDVSPLADAVASEGFTVGFQGSTIAL